MKLKALLLSLAAFTLLPFTPAPAEELWDKTDLGAAPATNDRLLLYDTSASATRDMTVLNLFTSPTLVTPTLGVATATSLNGLTITSSTGTFTLTNGKTLSVSNTLTFTGTDSSSVAFGTGGTVTYTANNLSVFAANTSAQLAGVLSNETGSGLAVFATSPTLTTPVLGAATATSINGLTLTSSTGTFTLTNGKTLSVSNTLTLAGTDGTTMTFPSTSATIARTDAANTFTGTQTIGALVATTVNGNTITAGSGVLTLAASKTLSASNTLTLAGTDGTTITFQASDTYVGRATTDTLTNKTIDLSSNTFTATSAQLATALSNETGSSLVVFNTSPTLVTPVLGAATATSINGLTITSTNGTLTLVNGSSLVTAGANSITLTSTGATDVTLPTTGTLATLAGTETLSSKTLTGAKVTPNVETITGDGAITIQSGVVLLTKGSEAAITLAAPSSQDGTIIEITSTTDFAHVVTVTGGLWDGTATTNTTITFPVVAGGAVRLIAFGTDWYVLSNQGTTIAP